MKWVGLNKRRYSVTEKERIDLSMNPQTARYSGYVLDNFGAPHLSELTICGAPSLDPAPNHLGSFILTTVLVKSMPDQQRRILFMLGRRILNAIYEYNVARSFLLEYVQKLPLTNNHFLRALDATTHFEQCIASAAQADLMFDRLVSSLDFQQQLGDARSENIRKLWNRSKHFDEDLAKLKAKVELSAPVWLTNTGLVSTAAALTFEELRSFLCDLLRVFEASFTSKMSS